MGQPHQEIDDSPFDRCNAQPLMLENFLDWLSNIPGEWALFFVIFLLLLCGLGLPLPEEIPIIAAGYLSYLEIVSLPVAIVLVMAAVLIGDVLLYGIGYRYGNRIFTINAFKNMLTPARMAKANHYFQRWGNRVVFIARFVAGVRGTVFLTAGILKMPFRRFVLLDGSAALITIPLNIFIVHRFGEEIGTTIVYLKEFKRFISLVLFLAIGILAIVFIIRRSQLRSKLQKQKTDQ